MQTGRKILNLRCDRKISQQELARASNITPSALSKIEAGINSPRANVLWRIAKNLGVTVEYLLDEQMPYPYPGYSYRQELLSGNEDPSAPVRMEVTKEEKLFVEALRKTSQVARQVSMAIPETSIETLRLLHFLLYHSKIQNPSQAFLQTFESLITTGNSETATVARTAASVAAEEHLPGGTPKRGGAVASRKRRGTRGGRAAKKTKARSR